MTIFSSFWSSISVLLAVLVAIFLAYPQPELNWDEFVLPMARTHVNAVQADDPQPLRGKVVLVTGATNGIGLELVRSFVKLGAQVFGHGRSEKKLAALKEELPMIQTVRADLANLDEVADMGNDLLRRRDEINKIDVLINNAGIHQGIGLAVMLGQVNFSTPQDFDKVFATNYLSHFLLTEKLAPLLSNSSDPTIIQMSSTFHWAVDGSDLMPEAFNVAPVAARPGGSHGFYIFRSQRSYANSKLAQIYHARALQKRHPTLSRARAISVCPAWVGTNIAGTENSLTYLFLKTFAFPVNGWAQASAFTALFSREISGDYLTNTKAFDPFLSLIRNYMPSWGYQVGLRDALMFVHAFAVGLYIQRFAAVAGSSLSSPESFNETITNALYDWSYRAVERYL